MMNNSSNCRLYIVRHGETDWNKAHKVQGHTDIPMNTRGEEQARMLGEKLKHIAFDAIYSSDLLRTKRTAELILLEKKIAIKTTEALRERRFGTQEGKAWEEIQLFRKYYKTLDKTTQKAYQKEHNYETEEELLARTITFLREVAVTHPGQTILITTHGGVMRQLLEHIGKEEKDMVLSVGNTSYIIIDSDGVDFWVKTMEGISFHPAEK